MMRQFRRAIAFAAAFLAAVATTNLQAAPGKVTFTVSGYTGAKTFTNFLVPVRISENSPTGFTYADVAANGADIVFYDANNAEIPYEIDTWNTSGESIIWVRLPSMTAGTTFTMEYGLSPRTTAAADTWAGFGAVFHMADGTDSAGGASGTFVTPSAANPVSGLFGQCHGSTTDSNTKQGPIMTFPVNDKMLAMASDGLTAAFTISGWIKKNGDSIWNWLFSNKTADDKSGFGVQYRGTNGAHTDLAVWPYSNKDTYITTYTGGAALWTTTWSKYDVVFNGSKTTIYINGAAIASGEKANWNVTVPRFNADSNFAIGGQDNAATRALRANVDEFRIRGEVLDADFIKAQFDAESKAGFLSAQYASLASFAVTVNDVSYDAANGKWVVPVIIKDGIGDIKCILTDADSAMTNTLATGVSVGNYSYELNGVPADKVYSVKIVADDGNEAFEYPAGTIYTGSLTLSVGDVRPLDGGTFTFRRSSVGAAISFQYSVGGTAVAGVDYRPISGVVTFAAGSDTANVDITVNDASTVDPAATVTLSMEGFPCTPASATLSLAGIYPVYTATDFNYNIDFTVAGAVAKTLDNFPVLVRMSSAKFPSLDWYALGENGENLVFLDGDGHRLYAEVEKCSESDDELIAWVRLPQIETGSTFTAAWGGVDVNVIPPFGTWKDYGGVWHMNGFAAADGKYVVSDSAGAFGEGGVKPMDAVATVAPVETDGPVGGALYGSAKEFILEAPDYDTRLDTAFECSFWYYSPDQNFTKDSQSYKLFCKEETFNAGTGWYFTQKWSTKGLGTDEGNQQMSFFASVDANNTGYITINSGHDPRKDWGYVQLFVTNGSATVFMNNKQVATKSGMTIYGSDWPFQISFETSRRDEVRFRKYPSKDAAVVAAWQQTEYASLTDDGFLDGLFKANRGLTPATATVRGNATDGFTLDTLLSGDTVGELYFVVSGADGVTTNLYSDAASGGEYSIPLASVLVANASYRVSALTKVGSVYSELAAGEVFYTGDLSIAAGGDAEAFTHQGSTFTITRAAGDAACAYDLIVNYTVGGTAVNGVDFVELSGTTVIPAGESSVVLAIDPILRGGASESNMTLSIALADGFYSAAAAASSAQIGFKGIAEIWLLSGDKKTMSNNDWILNVSVKDGKVTVTGIATAGTGTTLRFDWDAMDADGTRYPIRAIGYQAFTGNKVIRLVTFRDDLESVGYQAFMDCTNLGGEYRFGFNGPFTFGTAGQWSDGFNFANSRIEKVEMGEGVATIPQHAFKENPKLKTVVLPPTLERIPWMSFYGCSGLTTVTPFLPETVTHVGYGAFYNCTSLTGDLQFASMGGSSFGVDGEGTNQGNSDAFNGCKLITSVTIGNGLTGRIPSRAFYGCTALKTVRLPDVFEGNIAWNVFDGCTALETVTPLLPYGVTQLGYRAFGGCTKLKSDLVFDGTNAIKFAVNSGNGNQAFDNTKIESVYFGSCVTNVPSKAFSGCTAIKEMRFEEIVPVDVNAFGSLPDYQSKLYLSRASDACKDFVEDTANVTPWSSLDDTTQKLYTDAYPEEKLPRGLTTDATNLKKQWVFFFTPAGAEVNATMIMLR